MSRRSEGCGTCQCNYPKRRIPAISDLVDDEELVSVAGGAESVRALSQHRLALHTLQQTLQQASSQQGELQKLLDIQQGLWQLELVPKSPQRDYSSQVVLELASALLNFITVGKDLNDRDRDDNRTIMTSKLVDFIKIDDRGDSQLFQEIVEMLRQTDHEPLNQILGNESQVASGSSEQQDESMQWLLTEAQEIRLQQENS